MLNDQQAALLERARAAAEAASKPWREWQNGGMYHPIAILAGSDQELPVDAGVAADEVRGILADIVTALEVLHHEPETPGARRNRLLLEAEERARRGSAEGALVLLELANMPLSIERDEAAL